MVSDSLESVFLSSGLTVVRATAAVDFLRTTCPSRDRPPLTTQYGTPIFRHNDGRWRKPARSDRHRRQWRQERLSSFQSALWSGSDLESKGSTVEATFDTIQFDTYPYEQLEAASPVSPPSWQLSFPTPFQLSVQRLVFSAIAFNRSCFCFFVSGRYLSNNRNRVVANQRKIINFYFLNRCQCLKWRVDNNWFNDMWMDRKEPESNWWRIKNQTEDEESRTRDR